MKNLIAFNSIDGAIDTKEDLKKFLIGIYNAEPDIFANITVATPHDRLSESGVEVENNAGAHWLAYGDAHLDKSVQSKQYLQDAINLTLKKFEAARQQKPLSLSSDDIWQLTPHATGETGASFIAAEMEKMTSPANAELAAQFKKSIIAYMPDAISMLERAGHIRRVVASGQKPAILAGN